MKLDLNTKVWVVARQNDDFSSRIKLTVVLQGVISGISIEEDEDDTSGAEKTIYYVKLSDNGQEVINSRQKIRRQAHELFETEKEAKEKSVKINQAVSFLRENGF